MTVTTAPIWDALVKWININFFDYFDAVRTVLLLNVLNPFKLALLNLPWLGAVLITAYAGWRLRDRISPAVRRADRFHRRRRQWDKAMTTIYLSRSPPSYPASSAFRWA